MKFTSFENQLLDIMRSTTSMAIDPSEQIKGWYYYRLLNNDLCSMHHQLIGLPCIHNVQSVLLDSAQSQTVD